MKISILSVLAAACLLFAAGCETDSTTNTLTIEPGSASLEKFESMTFTVSGGYDYTWSIEDDTSSGTAWAQLSTRRGASTRYRSVHDPTSATVRVLTVISVIPGDTSTTNAGSYVATGEAYITHE